MHEGNNGKSRPKRNKIAKKVSGCKGVSKSLNQIGKGGPLVIVLLAAILLSCNVLWLYNTGGQFHRGICSYDTVSWGSNTPNYSSALLDYQRVHGSGLKGVPNPIPIPNDTVLVGTEQIISQDAQLHNVSGERRRFMTIGISSVWRKENYLYRTIDSIIKQTTEEEKLDIYIFLLLADAESHFRYERAKAIESRYRQHTESGLLRVLQPPSSLYPSIDFSKIRRTYNDPVERVQWRTKQVLDFVFLFWYTWARDPSFYYLILEDDILSAKHFVSATKDFVEMHKRHHWVSLQLAGFLGIGQLVRCRDLDRLVSFLLLFYTEHPVDILFNHWVSLMAPDKPPKDKPTRRVPGLFQHIGIHSTLANKTQPLKDSTFSLVKRRFSHVNPNADLVTTIRQYKTFVPELAYSSAPGMFWGIPKPKDTFDIVFSQPLHLARLFISTGTFVHNKKSISHLRDKLLFGHVEVSAEFQKMETPKKASCKKFEFLKGFKNGEIDFEGFPELFPMGVQCIRIAVDPPQRTWVAISEIAVFTMDEANPEILQQDGERVVVTNNPSEQETSENVLVINQPAINVSKSSANIIADNLKKDLLLNSTRRKDSSKANRTSNTSVNISQ